MKGLRTILLITLLFSVLAISSLANQPRNRGPNIPDGLSTSSLRGMHPGHPNFHHAVPIHGHSSFVNDTGYHGWHHHSGTLLHGPYYYGGSSWGWYPHSNYWGPWPADAAVAGAAAVGAGLLVGTAAAVTCCC